MSQIIDKLVKNLESISHSLAMSPKIDSDIGVNEYYLIFSVKDVNYNIFQWKLSRTHKERMTTLKGIPTTYQFQIL